MSHFGRFMRFWTNPEIQDGRHSEMVTQLLRHMTSQPHNPDVKGDIFRHTLYPPSVVSIAYIFSELRGGGGGGGRNPPIPVVEDPKKPGLNRVRQEDAMEP